MKYITKIDSIIYDENLDILELYTSNKTHHCIEVSNLFIIHCNDKNKVVGLELLGISNIFHIDKILLTNLKSAKLVINAIPEEKKVFITAKIISLVENKQISTNLLVTPEAPLLCN